MTDDDIKALREALDNLEHWSEIVGRVQARKESGSYSEFDARTERVAHEAAAKVRAHLLAEVERLRGERDALLETNARFAKRNLADMERMFSLEQERDAMKPDAERYRWLRDSSKWDPFDSAWLCASDLYGQEPADMDAFIDAARKDAT